MIASDHDVTSGRAVRLPVAAAVAAAFLALRMFPGTRPGSSIASPIAPPPSPAVAQSGHDAAPFIAEPVTRSRCRRLPVAAAPQTGSSTAIFAIVLQ